VRSWRPTSVTACPAGSGAAPPPPPAKKRRGVSPNAALIAGVGTLLLALGIGVLIGRSGTHQVAAASAAPQIVRVQGGGGGEEEESASTAKTTTGGKGKAPKTEKAKDAALKEAEAHPAAEDILKPSAGVKLPPAAVQPGDKCEEGAAGCKGGEFNGNFFGE
jgi:hypothetical protein